MARTWMDMHRLRRLHDSQYIMKNPFTNENSNLSNIFHNNIHRKKVESLKVRSTEEFLCQFAWLPCRFFRGRRQGRQPLNIYIYIIIYIVSKSGRIPNVTTRRQRSKNRGWCTKFVAPSNGIWCAFPRFSFIGLTVFQMFQHKRSSIVAYRRIRPAIEHHWRLLVSILWQLKREGSSRVVKICQNWVGICFGVSKCASS